MLARAFDAALYGLGVWLGVVEVDGDTVGSCLQHLIQQYPGMKEKLFDKKDLFEDRISPDKGISMISNTKLLKLHEVASEVKERFNTRANLIEDLSKIMGRINDEGLKSRFEKWGLPRLWDYYQSVAKRQFK